MRGNDMVNGWEDLPGDRAERPVPPPFPTVTVHTSDGDVTMPCEPVGEHLAITATFLMLEGETPGTFEVSLPGTFDVRLRSTGVALTETGGCIACARRYARLLIESPVDWSATEKQITEQAMALPEQQRSELASGRDMSWSCDAEWCDHSGPGIVLLAETRG